MLQSCVRPLLGGAQIAREDPAATTLGCANAADVTASTASLTETTLQPAVGSVANRELRSEDECG